jgi:hypothetical protein
MAKTSDNPALFAFLSERARKGGKARLTKMTAEERSRVARLGAQARWGKKTEAPPPNDPKGPKRDPQRQGILSTRKPCGRTGASLPPLTIVEVRESAHGAA